MKHTLTFLLLFALAQLGAVTITVTNTAPAGPGSLTDAVATAVAGDVIAFDPATNGIPIFPAGTLNITEAITIRGNGCQQTIITGGGVQQIFFVSGGPVTLPWSVRFQRLSLVDGNSPTNGGAIETWGTSLLTSDVCFENNRAQGATAGEGGGAVYALDCPYRSVRCSFIGNAAPNGNAAGGAVHVIGLGHQHLASRFFNNFAAGRGGAVYDESITAITSLLIRDCGFSTNRAEDGGAFSSASSDNTLIRRSFFGSNEAQRSGGGAHNTAGLLRVRNSNFFGNQALAGFASAGGGALFGNNGSLRVYDACRIEDNYSTGSGGGVFNGLGGEVRVIDSEVLVNRAEFNGGGVASYSTNTGDVRLIRSQLVDNEAINEHGGGLFTAGFPNVIITESELRTNKALLSGGGAYVGGNQLSITDSDISGNAANGSSPSAGGGGLYTTAQLNTIQGTNFSDNGAPNGQAAGGAIHTADNARLRLINGNSVQNNEAAWYGGGVAINSVGVTSWHHVWETKFVGNRVGSPQGSGGGIRLDDTNRLLCRDADFMANYGGYSGGALHLDYTTETTVEGGLIEDNQADLQGGGIATEVVDLNLRGVTLASNVVLDPTSGFGGGGLFTLAGTIRVQRSAFLFNEASLGGGYRNWDSPDVRICTSTFSHNVGAVGAGVFSEVGTTLRNVTIVRNNGSGFHGTANSVRSIIHDNAGPNIDPTSPWSGTRNLLDGPYPGLTGPPNIFAPTALLGPLTSLPLVSGGGSSWGHLPLCGSPAVGAGGTPTTTNTSACNLNGIDQLGGNAVGNRDIGAIEDAVNCPARAVAEEVVPGSTSPEQTVGDRPAVFPNPAAAGQSVTLRVPADFGDRTTVILRDLTGRTLNQVTVTTPTHEMRLPANLPAGTYLLEFTNAHRREVRKLQLQR